MNGVAEALWIRISEAVERKQTYVHIRIDEIQMAIDELERLDLVEKRRDAEVNRLRADYEGILTFLKWGEERA